jgi:hypothetical protein
MVVVAAASRANAAPAEALEATDTTVSYCRRRLILQEKNEVDRIPMLFKRITRVALTPAGEWVGGPAGRFDFL